MRVDSFFVGGVQAGFGAAGAFGAPAGPGASGASGPLNAGAFDGILGDLLSPVPVVGESSAGALGDGVPGRSDESLPIRGLLPCDAREATDTGTTAAAWAAGALQAEAAPVSAAAPPAAPVSAPTPLAALGSGAPATEASAQENSAGEGSAEAIAYQFLAPLPGMPYERHDLQPGVESGQGVAAGESVAGDPGIGGLGRFDGSLPVRRHLPSNPQQGIEPAGLSADVPWASAVGTPVATPAGIGSAEAPQDHFLSSLSGVPLARHDLQPGIESGQGVAAGACLAGDPGAVATPDVDDSLPASRLQPSNPQQGIESGYPATAKESVPVIPGAVPIAHPDDSVLPGRLLPSGAPVSVETGNAGATERPGPGTSSAMPDAAQQESTPVGMGSGSPLAGYAPAATDGIAAEATEPEGKAHNGVPVFVAQHTRQPGIEPADAAATQPAPGVPQPATPGVPAPTQAAPAVVLHAQPHPGMQPQSPAQQQQPLAHQLAQPLFTLASARPGEHVMTVQVSPEDLGPLTVRAHIDGAGVRIELFASGEAGREAVRHVLPELRRGLEDAGASLSLSSHNNPQDAPKDTGAGGRQHGQTGYQGPVHYRQSEALETAPSPHHAQSPNQLDILV